MTGQEKKRDLIEATEEMRQLIKDVLQGRKKVEPRDEERVAELFKGNIAEIERFKELYEKLKDRSELFSKEELAEFDRQYADITEAEPLYRHFVKYLEGLRELVFKFNRNIAKDIAEFTQGEPVRAKDFAGVITEAGQEKQKFTTKEGYYLQSVLPEQLALPGFNTPAVTVEFAKHMLNVFDLIDRSNKRRDKQGLPPETKIEFSLPEYARQRGRADREIKRGGKFLAIYKHQIITGATTCYMKELPEHYKIGHFYELEIPKERKGKWSLSLSQSYAEAYYKTQSYLPVWKSIINDKETEGKGQYKFFFVFYGVTPQLNTTGKRRPGDFINVLTLLDKAKAGERVKQRDREAFDKLMGGIDYSIRRCNNLQAVIFAKELKRGQQVKTVTIPEGDLGKFNSWTYEVFRAEVLEPLEVKYCRDLLVAFMGKPASEPEETPASLPERAEVKIIEPEHIKPEDFF